ncbi:MAG: pyruvate,orthophosphate dikinase, partial [Planctomycetota bacterium]
KFYGEYLLNAQGEDVVAGLRTPQAIDGLRETLPAAWEELLNIQEKLEDHFGDMQDLEFTIQEGQLYMLQCRAGKRTGFAALRIASEMVGEGRIDTAEAVRRVPPDAIDQVLQPVFADRELAQARELGRYLCKGLNAGPGAATGRIAFSSQRAQEIAAGGETVVLVRIETSPEDIKGMQASVGILTARGGMTSHAALVARQMGKVCIAGAEELIIDYAHARMDIAGKTLREGDWLSLDGTKGEVYEGLINTVPSEVHAAIFGTDDRAIKARDSQLYKAYQNVLSWADQHRRMRVRTNADQPDQCETAIRLGAEGIGLCRTEHMFFGEEKIGAMRAMILAENSAARERALTKLLPLQRADFEGVFRAMAGRPVTIRTLDPPLHEFLPHGAEATVKLAAQLGVTIETIEEKVEQLSEQNPMLGHRGCRLGISQPEITRMQARAIFEAACIVKLEGGPFPQPEIMIPLVCTARELRQQAKIIRDTAAEVFEEMACNIPYLIGTMIELPRAALRAGNIANEADFFSFGTNDLTQTTFGLSRDDGGSFLPRYQELGILQKNPFAAIDRRGVGRLMQIAVDEGKETRPDIKLGICGEHGGEPSSIEFCEDLGLSYVSCSPYRVPVARLAAAQAALREKP